MRRLIVSIDGHIISARLRLSLRLTKRWMHMAARVRFMNCDFVCGAECERWRRSIGTCVGRVDGWFGSVDGWFGSVDGWFGSVDGMWSMMFGV